MNILLLAEDLAYEDLDLQIVRPYATVGLGSIHGLWFPYDFVGPDVKLGLPVLETSNQFNMIFGNTLEKNIPASHPMIYRNCADADQSRVNRAVGTKHLYLAQFLTAVKWIRGSHGRGLVPLNSLIVGRVRGYAEMPFFAAACLLEHGITLHAFARDTDDMWPKDTYFIGA